MILQAARDMGLDLAHSWMIGDQERDMQAGHAAGVQTILVSPNGELARRTHPTAVAKSFDEAVGVVLGRSSTAGDSEAAAAIPKTPPAKAPLPAATPAEGPNPQMEFNQLRRALSDLTEEMRSDRAYLEQIRADLVARGLQVNTKLALGDPATELIKAAEEQK